MEPRPSGSESPDDWIARELPGMRGFFFLSDLYSVDFFLLFLKAFFALLTLKFLSIFGCVGSLHLHRLSLTGE